MGRFATVLSCGLLGALAILAGCSTQKEDPQKEDPPIDVLALKAEELPAGFSKLTIGGQFIPDDAKSTNKNLISVFEQTQSSTPECIDILRVIRVSPEPNNLLVSEKKGRTQLNWLAEANYDLEQIAGSIRNECSKFTLTSESVGTVPAHTQNAEVVEVGTPMVEGSESLILRVANSLTSDEDLGTVYELCALTIVNGYSVRVSIPLPQLDSTNDIGTPIFNEWTSDIEELTVAAASKIESLT